MSATTWHPYAVADDSWSDGAHQVWSAQLPANSEIVVAKDYVVSVEHPSGANTSAALTGYSVSDAGASQLWTATMDLKTGTPGSPAFQVWNDSTLVHGSMLVDLATGTVSSAPWAEQDRPLVLEDRVITCSGSNVCSGWEPGGSLPLWTASVEDSHSALEQLSRPQAVNHRNGARYALVGDRAALNIDTGEAVSFEVPALQSWAIWSAADGWTVVSWDQTLTTWHMYEYGVEGGAPTGDYAGNPPWASNESPLYSASQRTREQFRGMWTDNEPNGIVGRAYFGGGNNDECFERFEAIDGPSIEIPTITTGGSTDVITQTNSSCATRVGVDSDNRTATVHLNTRPTENVFVFMYNTATGEAISFEGTDAMSGDQLALVNERLVVGYDVDTGSLYGYTPAD